MKCISDNCLGERKSTSHDVLPPACVRRQENYEEKQQLLQVGKPGLFYHSFPAMSSQNTVAGRRNNQGKKLEESRIAIIGKNQCYSQMVQAFHQLGCHLKNWQPVLNIWQKDTISDQQENFQLYSKVLTTMSLNKLTVWLIAIN